MTVLVVEDEPDQLTIRSLLLRQSGFTVVEAESDRAAMAAVELQLIDCAVVDLRLPTERDGCRLIRYLKESNPDIAIVILTGSLRTGAVGRWPEMALVERVFGKGESAAPLLQYLRSVRARQDV